MTRIDQPRTRRSRGTRAAILDAAWRLLEEGGGAALTMSAAAQAAGVSRRGLYLHFASRGELFAALIEHIDAELDLASSLRPVREAPDAVAALDAWAAHVVTYHGRIAAVARAVERARHDDPDAAALWERATAAWLGACRGLAGALAEEGRLADGWTAESAADLLWALMSPALVDDLASARGWTTDAFVARLRLLVRRTLVA